MFNAYYFGRHLLGIGKMPAVTGHGCASLDRCETYGFRSLDTAVPRWTGVKRVDSLFFLTSGKQQRDGAQVGPLFFLFFFAQGWDPPGLPVDIRCRGSISWALGA